MLVPSCLWYDRLNHPQVMLRSKSCHLFFGNNFGRFLGKLFEIILWSLPHLTHYSTRKNGDGLFAWEPMHQSQFVKNIFSAQISKWLGCWPEDNLGICTVLFYLIFLSVGIVQVKNRNKHWGLLVTSLKNATHLGKQTHKWNHLGEGLVSTP